MVCGVLKQPYQESVAALKPARDRRAPRSAVYGQNQSLLCVRLGAWEPGRQEAQAFKPQIAYFAVHQAET